jgi:hypothetical protein
VRGCIRKLFLVGATTKVVRNTVEDVKFIVATMACSVLVVALRMSPTNRRDKELRQSQLRREEQDRIIRIIKGTKKYQT